MSSTTRWVAAVLLIGLAAFLGFSRLGMSPVPWPDGPAFFLPGIELVQWQWPPQWRMHSQAAFVPSYDQANFNTLPSLPLLLGLAHSIGLTGWLGEWTATESTRFLQLLALAAFAWMTLSWLWPRSRVASVALAALVMLDPIDRWGALVVRTEVWVGLCWLWLLRDQSLNREEFKPWRIAAPLALAASFHFEAIALVPAAAALLWGGDQRTPGRFLRANLQVAWRTLALLSPWLLYVLANLDLFWEQMQIQFTRLALVDTPIHDLYSAFHALFPSLGNPEGWPKLLNVGKALFWLIALTLTGYSLAWVRRDALVRAGMVGFWSSVALWLQKPEVWFVTLCHLMLWSWLTCALRPRGEPSLPGFRRAGNAFTLLSAACAFVLAAVNATQFAQADPEYSWKNFRRWVECISVSAGSEPLRIWQPYAPEVLTELGASTQHDLTRAFDFSKQAHLIPALLQRTDLLIISSYLGEKEDYAGPAREKDFERMKDGVTTPYGPMALELLDGPTWTPTICSAGPFWATLLFR